MVFRSVFFRRLFLPYMLLICMTAGTVGFFSAVRLRETYIESRRHALRDDLLLIWQLIRDDVVLGRLEAVQDRIEGLGRTADCRITVVAGHGAVLADNWADPAAMDNHLLRPEFQGALTEGTGESQRLSDTIDQQMLYMAGRFQEAGLTYFLRVAVPLRAVREQLVALYAGLAVVGTVAVLLSGLICYHFARRHATPVVELTDLARSLSLGDLERRTAVSGRGEIGTLGAALNTMAGSMEDLRAQAASDRSELLTILSTMSEGVIATDVEQRILVVNNAAATLLNFDAGQALGKPLWQVIRIDRIIKAAAETLATGQRVLFELSLSGGRHLEVCLCIYRSAMNQNGLVLVAHDTTQSVRYQELRKEFVANVSHELRTPLTVISGFVETLKGGALNDPVKGPQYIATIERHTHQLTNLVNDLLELSRLESQPDLPRRQAVDIAMLARKAIEMLLPAAQRKNQSIVQEIEHVPMVAGNPDYLERAITNLLDNAIKYTPDGGNIEVATRAEDHAVIVEVRDNGLGIPKADLPRIFERFYRVDRSRSRDMGGTGLGLSIVKHIVQAHNGAVEVDSAPGQGSMFRFRIPVSDTPI